MSSNQQIETLNQEKDSLNGTINSLRAEVRTRDESSSSLLVQLANAQRRIIQINRAHEQKHQCESLYAQGRIHDAAECLLETANIVNEDMGPNKLIMDWLSEFTHRCIMTLERVGDEASIAGKRDEAVASYSTALSLGPSTPNALLMKWAGVILIRDSVDEVLRAAASFKVPQFAVYRVFCGILEEDGRLTEAVGCFRQLQNALPEDTDMHDERMQWERDFRGRCVETLEKLGDTARDSQKHDEAIGYYSTALLLDPPNVNDILLKRSNEVIKLDPSSHRGYEGRHAALHGMERHDEAFKAFRIMLSKLEQSPDSQIRKLGNQYVDATATIREVVEETIRDMPPAFEELPIYDELRSSMTTRLNLERIQEEVKKFYQYVMFSHRWQLNEPTFQEVEKTPVYNLPESPAFSKLKIFCKLVHALHFEWAWSDYESLFAMFRWYRGSSLTIVHLLGVLSQSQKKGCLWKSIWNTRGWTYQEYVASGVVQFYTEDWKPYLGLDIFNHKESPIILSEMEQAMNFATEELASLQPGLERAREKLYLASMRQTTREEDIAYSLFGIFNVAIPVMYGEGNQAVSRLLEHILTRSDNVTLLAWTGRSAGVLYERLYHLPPLSLVAGRLRLPGIVFPLTDLVPLSESDPDCDVPGYRATSAMLGDVEIKTTAEFSRMDGLLLIHPWISPLLDQDFSCGASRFDHATRALRLFVRLRQSFGALLLAPLGRVQYRRVATDSLIMVRIREETSLAELTDGIRTIDIQ
ncbi:hypothetical protein HD554DRAFT_2302552 [Boletus coccyginus]|nr:hypothetical protein HD554DRAFT_2302552 [Boletus coccyginus]